VIVVLSILDHREGLTVHARDGAMNFSALEDHFYIRFCLLRNLVFKLAGFSFTRAICKHIGQVKLVLLAWISGLSCAKFEWEFNWWQLGVLVVGGAVDSTLEDHCDDSEIEWNRSISIFESADVIIEFWSSEISIDWGCRSIKRDITLQLILVPVIPEGVKEDF
jgi:hypothetical protein